MSKLIVMLFLLVSLPSSCAPIPLRPFDKRTYFFCKKEWLTDYVGKACYTYCEKTAWYSPSKCVKESMIIEDLNDESTFLRFLNSGKRISRPDTI